MHVSAGRHRRQRLRRTLSGLVLLAAGVVSYAAWHGSDSPSAPAGGGGEGVGVRLHRPVNA